MPLKKNKKSRTSLLTGIYNRNGVGVSRVLLVV